MKIKEIMTKEVVGVKPEDNARDALSLLFKMQISGLPVIDSNNKLVGSTANIVALGILEKERNVRLAFFRWFWVGLCVGVATTTVVWLFLLLQSH